ncbi:MAG: hypothetical protein ACRDAM_20585 [Casimicrobium sp.]
MSITLSRREFVASGALGAAALTTALPHPVFADELHVDDTLLSALGARIGLEVSQTLAPAGEALAISYIDCASPDLIALREGVAQGASWQCDRGVSCATSKGGYASVLGIALFKNTMSGREARVEIDKTALSHIAMIESASTSKSIQKHAVMVAPADSMYRVAYSV